MECDKKTESAYSIQLNKSISFHGGSDGRPIIKCNNGCGLFVIKYSSLKKFTRIAFHNLVVNVTARFVECSKAFGFEVALNNTDVLTFNNESIHTKSCHNCAIRIQNSTLYGHGKKFGFIWLKCTNLTVNITNSVFKKNPIWLQTTEYNTRYSNWQTVKVYVRNSIFDGQHTNISTHLFAIRPFAAVVLDISIWNSRFLNHTGYADKHTFSSLIISEKSQGIHLNSRYISLRNLTVKNSRNEMPAVNLRLVYDVHAPFQVEIRDSIFENNSAALVLRTLNNSKIITLSDHPKIIVYNNNFSRNFGGQSFINAAPAIFFNAGSYRMTSCRFYDNKSGKSPFSAVVTVAEFSNVVLSDCHFESNQTAWSASQFYARGHSNVVFSGINIFNILALNTTQAVFLRIPFHKETELVIRNNFKVLCPLGYVLSSSQRVCHDRNNSLHCTFIYLICSKCPEKTYALERAKFVYNVSNHVKCMQCPRGGNCVNGKIMAKPNFWGYKGNKSITFAQCPPGYCCHSTDCVRYDSCHGNRNGTLCGRCPKGMSDSLFTSQCTLNTRCTGSLFIPCAIAILVLYLLFFLYNEEIFNVVRKNLFGSLNIFRARRHTKMDFQSKRMKSGAILKVIFYYYQAVRLLQNTVAPPSDANNITAKMKRVISRLFNFIFLDVSSFSCPIKNLQSIQKVAILHSFGYCLLALIGILYLITTLLETFSKLAKSKHNEMRPLLANRSQRKHSKFKARIASAFTYISLLMYASSAQLCLSLLHCVHIGNDHVLFLDGDIKCYQTFQYYVFAYVVSSLLPFCLVPILGAYLLKMDRISVRQFCIACIFPLPFCCFWSYLMVKDYRSQNKQNGLQRKSSRKDPPDVKRGYFRRSRHRNDCLETTQEHDYNETSLENSLIYESIKRTGSDFSERYVLKRAILRVLLGPFRCHKAFLCFPSSVLPWEGYLIFRRLALILILTFVHDNILKMMLTLTLFVAILTSHMYFKPFIRPRDNAIETLSLSTLTILCGLTLIKSLYYGEDVSLMSDSLGLLNFLNWLENAAVVAPLAILVFILVLATFARLLYVVRKFL